MATLIAACSSPSEAFWRYFELKAVRGITYPRPILEIGCGNGIFSGLAFDRIEDAIDINPRAVDRAQKESGVYDRVLCMDARRLGDAAFGGYGTVFANCVLEHIPNLSEVLVGARRSLRRGGQLVATVPLVQMNDYLVLRKQWYARLRQRQLTHVNLLSADEWRSEMIAAGFSDVRITPYLFGSQCLFWDMVDAPSCIGTDRYRAGAAIKLVRDRFLPARWATMVNQLIARKLISRSADQPKGRPCAALIVAT